MRRALSTLRAACAVVFFAIAMAIVVAISRAPADQHPGFGD